jgi:hypothetical protein
VVGAIFGVARLRRDAEIAPLLRALVAVGIVATVAYGPIPFWKNVPLGQKVGSAQYRVTARNHAADDAVALVPAGAPVSATNTMGAHLSARRRIFSFPLLDGARWVVVDTLRMSYLDNNLDRTRGLQALRTLRHNPAWHVVFARKGILVLHQGPPTV